MCRRLLATSAMYVLGPLAWGASSVTSYMGFARLQAFIWDLQGLLSSHATVSQQCYTHLLVDSLQSELNCIPL